MCSAQTCLTGWKYQRYICHVLIHPEHITLHFLLPAHVEVYAQNSKDGAKILLTCIARGQGVIDMEIKRNGETVKKGLMRSDTEPNIDGTLEIRAHVEISKDDKPEYSYEVIYEAPKNPTVNTFVCALPWSEPSELRPALKTVNPQSWHEINELLVCYTDTRRF